MNVPKGPALALLILGPLGIGGVLLHGSTSPPAPPPPGSEAERRAIAEYKAGVCHCPDPTSPAGACPSDPPTRAKVVLASARSNRPDVPTYARDIAPIVQRHCQECHRDGNIAPFPLLTYQQVKSHATDIATLTTDRRMPPWPAERGFESTPFRHDRSLTEQDIDRIADWVDAGAPEGDPADLPPNPSFPEGWSLGTPDLVLEMPEAFEVPASGEDIYRCFVIPTGLAEDAQVIGVEYQPGNPRVVHHIIGYVDATGAARERDEEEPGDGYTCFGGPRIEPTGDLGGWAPGATAGFLPDGIGRIVPKGSDVVLQVHYHASGKPETDRSRVGLYFAKPDRPVRQAFHWWAAGAEGFTIPAGEPAVRLQGSWTMPVDVQLVAVSPHMHLIGRQMTMTARLPDGAVLNLIRIPDWDFNWQLQYLFERPIDLPEGTVIEVDATYDNSTANRNQPEGGPRPVKFGEATYDEMCYGFFGVVKRDQDLTRPGERDDLLEIFARKAGQQQEDDQRPPDAAAGDE